MLENLRKYSVFKYFEEISKIPRKSGNEQEIVKYLVNFAKERNLKYYTDKYNNIVIIKEASKGQEFKKAVAIQAHTDMICEKQDDVQHDFLNDPLELYIEGDYIKAKGTTLGADNGIGVAYILALLDSDDIISPKLECIFTSEEETTMLGAINLDMDKIESNRIISLDGSKEGKMLISSAECKEWICTLPYKTQKNEYKYCYELVYENFKGGHSGGNIADEKRGNPIKLGVELLKKLKTARVIQINGGSRVNVIPRNVNITFATNDENVESILQEYINFQKQFYGEQVNIALGKIKHQEKVLDERVSNNLIGFIFEFENGAIKTDEEGNVVQSGNMAQVNIKENEVNIAFSQRSNVKEAEEQYLDNLSNLISKYSLTVKWTQNLKGVPKKDNNNLANTCKAVYEKMFGEDMEQIISQGVVEGGFFVSKKQDCEYICIGPNLYDAHSPSERLSIKSTLKVWKYLKELIRKI